MQKEELKKHFNKVMEFWKKSEEYLKKIQRCPWWRMIKFHKLIRDHRKVLNEWKKHNEILNKINEKKKYEKRILSKD